MRLFIGVELDERTQAAAADAGGRLKARLERDVPDLAARWVPRDNLHLTLWFIGEVDDTRAAALRAALERPFEEAPFELTLAGCGAFPPSGPPRVFWIGAPRGADRMAALYAELGARLEPLGFLPERRGYTTHLTLARVREGARGSARPVRRALASVPADCGSCRIAAVTLFRSRLSPRGAAYEPMLRVPLG